MKFRLYVKALKSQYTNSTHTDRHTHSQRQTDTETDTQTDRHAHTDRQMRPNALPDRTRGWYNNYTSKTSYTRHRLNILNTQIAVKCTVSK